MTKNPYYRVKDTTAPGIGESPALAKVLNFDSESSEAQDNPPQRGEIDEAEMRLAEITPTRDETEPGNGTPEQDKETAAEQEIGDLPDIELSDADRLMDKVYGDHVHQNPGTHLDGRVTDDQMYGKTIGDGSLSTHRRPTMFHRAPSGVDFWNHSPVCSKEFRAAI